MRKLRKNTQLNFINIKGAGRPAIHDVGIRHISRPKIVKRTALHLTIKVRENKADIKSKRVLKALHHAIKRARLKKLKILHYTLEYNHIHLLVESCDNQSLKRGMQALGISLSKAINRIKSLKGHVYKHRYHFRKLNTRTEFKNALCYILKNGIKHKRTAMILDPYNSAVGEKRIPADMKPLVANSFTLSNLRNELLALLDDPKVHFLNTYFLWNA